MGGGVGPLLGKWTSHCQNLSSQSYTKVIQEGAMILVQSTKPNVEAHL